MHPTQTPTEPETRKRPLAQARADAEAFAALFTRDHVVRWQVAGSVRRREPLVSDVDHVVVPRFGELPAADLFRTPERTNLLWHHLDALVAGRHVDKWVRANGTVCWGDKQRAVLFRGFKHEVWTADADNWGSVLAIRTGPGEFSHRLVIDLQKHGHANADGYVVSNHDWRCPCGWAGPDPAWLPIAEARRLIGRLELDGTSVVRAPGDAKEAAARCPACGTGTKLFRARVPAPDEATYFRLAGAAAVPAPWDRRA
ncbi:MAG TPA: hypothetical protein VF796_13625 [Humisphaera sp.]